MAEFEDKVLEERNDEAKLELVNAVINSIESLSGIQSRSQKHHIFNAIETIIQHPSIDSETLSSQILPHVFTLLKEELPKEDYYAVSILMIISKKCTKSRGVILDMVRHLMEQLKSNYKLFHDELNTLSDKYGEILESDNTQPQVERQDSDNSLSIFRKISSSSLLSSLKSSSKSKESLADLENSSMLPVDVLPSFIELLRRKTDLHAESIALIKYLASFSGPNFDPHHILTDFLVNFAEWNNRSKSRSSKMFRQMVAKCVTPEHSEALVKSDILMDLVETLLEGSSSTQREAMWIVKILAKQPMLHDAILATPVLIKIVECLSNGSADIRKDAYWTLEACCQQANLKEAIFQLGALPGMISFVNELHLDDPEALNVLSIITHDDTSSPSKEVSEQNILSRVVNVLRNGSESDQAKAKEILITLANGVSEDHLQCAFAESGAVSTLVDMLRGKHQTKMKALKVVTILAKNGVLRRMIIDTGNGLETLVGMVQTGPEEVKLGAGRILAQMIRDPEMHQEIFMSGLFHVVMAFITHDHGGKGKWDSNVYSYNTKLLSVELISLFAADDNTRDVISKTQISIHLKHLMHHETGTLEEHAHELLKRIEGEGSLGKIFHHIIHRDE